MPIQEILVEWKNQSLHFGVLVGLCEDCMCPSNMTAQTSYKGSSFFFSQVPSENIIVSFDCQMLIIKANRVIRVNYYLRCLFLFQWLPLGKTLSETGQRKGAFMGGVGFVPRVYAVFLAVCREREVFRDIVPWKS